MSRFSKSILLVFLAFGGCSHHEKAPECGVSPSVRTAINPLTKSDAEKAPSEYDQLARVLMDQRIERLKLEQEVLREQMRIQIFNCLIPWIVQRMKICKKKKAVFGEEHLCEQQKFEKKEKTVRKSGEETKTAINNFKKRRISVQEKINRMRKDITHLHDQLKKLTIEGNQKQKEMMKKTEEIIEFFKKEEDSITLTKP